VRNWRVIVVLALSACATTPAPESTAADHFFNSFARYCGQSFSGNLVAGDATDSSFSNADMRAHFAQCDSTKLEIKFDVGEDRSRTWIISKTPTGLRLKHRHMLKDGSEDPVSQYGGDTADMGSANRQQFPVDEFSKAMFTQEGRTVSNANVWAFEIAPGASFTYELSRPNRLFRVAFDLTRPLAPVSR
jgi:hypothetical protein